MSVWNWVIFPDVVQDYVFALFLRHNCINLLKELLVEFANLLAMEYWKVKSLPDTLARLLLVILVLFGFFPFPLNQ